MGNSCKSSHCSANQQPVHSPLHHHHHHHQHKVPYNSNRHAFLHLDSSNWTPVVGTGPVSPLCDVKQMLMTVCGFIWFSSRFIFCATFQLLSGPLNRPFLKNAFCLTTTHVTAICLRCVLFAGRVLRVLLLLGEQDFANR